MARPARAVFNEGKTGVVAFEDGFDFVGYNIRRYPNGKLLIKPSKAAVRRIRKRLAAEVKALHGANAQAVINKRNPVIRGWAAYPRTVVSKEVFCSLDHYVWRLLYKWARRSQPNNPRRRVIARYFGAFHPARRDRWVFGERASGRYLAKFSWTRIVRHQQVKGRASPDDPDLTDYWTTRRRRKKPPVGQFAQRLLKVQHRRCPACGDLLLRSDQEPQGPQEWERWFRTVHKAMSRKAIVPDGADPSNERVKQRLLHTSCAKRPHGRHQQPALLPAHETIGLA